MYNPVDRTQLPVVIGQEGVLIGNVVAAQPRPNPIVIPDAVPGLDADLGFVAENVGVLNIRSVYDLDGVDVAVPDIGTLADPAFATAAGRPARFVRLVKAVSIPDEDIVELENTDFGPNILQGMREIVGYAPVEPDGSVRIKVPANVALGIEVLDANGRRITARRPGDPASSTCSVVASPSGTALNRARRVGGRRPPSPRRGRRRARRRRRRCATRRRACGRS